MKLATLHHRVLNFLKWSIVQEQDSLIQRIIREMTWNGKTALDPTNAKCNIDSIIYELHGSVVSIEKVIDSAVRMLSRCLGAVYKFRLVKMLPGYPIISWSRSKGCAIGTLCNAEVFLKVQHLWSSCIGWWEILVLLPEKVDCMLRFKEVQQTRKIFFAPIYLVV